MQDVKSIRGKGNKKHFAANRKTTTKSVNKLGEIVYGSKLKQEHNLLLSHQKVKKRKNTCMRISMKDRRNKNYNRKQDKL